jgi:hypothetical protein
MAQFLNEKQFLAIKRKGKLKAPIKTLICDFISFPVRGDHQLGQQSLYEARRHRRH